MARNKKERYVLVDAQQENKLELHVAFYGNDHDDQIVCDLPEIVVLELVRKDLGWREIMPLPKDFEIDGDVKDYIKKKYSL